ncbi:NAD kinase [subsurface metagenome]
MKKIGILYHPMNDAARGMAEEVKTFLAARGIAAWLCSAWEAEEAKPQVDGTDLLLSIGGDGTILRAAQIAAGSGEPLPITGINLGKLGFMTELGAAEVKEKLPALLEGKGWLDERAMLEATIDDGTSYYALNDVVVARGAVARVVYIEASIDGKKLTTYKADGVVVATATGSTGYSLSAGGPILHPRAKEFLLSPILPHLSLGYSLVLPSTAVVKLRLATVHEATLSIDGHINPSLADGSVITVRHSATSARFLRIHPENAFYSSLEQKLKGKH